ncbi:CYFA0S32e00430g1_1 [Cyberlindnera fabianii]|uniref:CYFA0S32e00430g1_1 n=1 Tax=Cyberlindnera fabianii TaxID=36022 RepID=A0A061BDJ1_CYBFA|nr:CYFA0S32e00430g1_1 [Cyberlindnera fabianii]
MDLDDVLNLEEQFYQEGFREGQAESTKKSYIEGKEYGLQFGFQKFVLMGEVNAIVELLANGLVGEPLSSQAESNLSQMRELLDQIKMDNESENVLESQRIMIKVKNKLRVLSNLIKKQVTLNQLNDMANHVSGVEKEKTQANIALNDDGMW